MPPVRSSPATLVRGLSLLGVVALVVGNMVGTSIYTLPASLAAKTGPLGIVAWVVTALGYFFVAAVYASLGTRYPRSGGPYVYAREAFGDFAGFQTVWSYWFSAVVGNAAIVTSVIGYLIAYSAPLSASVPLQFLLAQILLWGLCWLNVRGVRQSGQLQIAIGLVTVVPLILIALLSLGSVERANFLPFAPHGAHSLAAGLALVVWAYSGVESATVPAEEVQAPERTIRRGTMVGYALGTVIYVICAVAASGTIPNAELATSARPLALVAERAVGNWAGQLMSFAAIAGGLGTLNGWTLMAGRIPLSAARDGLFFRSFGRIHPRFGTPHVALIAGTAIASAMCLMYFSRTLLGVFDFVVLLAVLTTLLPHLYAAAAEWLLARRGDVRYDAADRRRALRRAPIAFVFTLYTVYGVGAEVALWGFLVVLAGIPLYIVLGPRSARISDAMAGSGVPNAPAPLGAPDQAARPIQS